MLTELSSSSAALLIEPDLDLVRTFRELIVLAYHSSATLDVVFSLEDGLTYLEAHHVPVILMDLSLPGNSEREAVERVRARATSSAIIGFHQTSDPTKLSDAIRAGAHEVLAIIPPSAETLRLSITSALIRAARPQTVTEPVPSTEALPTSSFPLTKVAHDLNNCLTSINGFTDILLARLSAEDPSQYCAGQIKLACTRAAGLIKQLPQITTTAPAPHLSKPANNASAT